MLNTSPEIERTMVPVTFEPSFSSWLAVTRAKQLAQRSHRLTRGHQAHNSEDIRPADAQPVNVTWHNQIRYWAQEFKCTRSNCAKR